MLLLMIQWLRFTEYWVCIRYCAKHFTSIISKTIRDVLLLFLLDWKDWCWSWNSNTLATWWEKLTPWKRPWYWERLKAGGEGDDRGWDGWMASLTQLTWVWVNSGSWWWTGRPGVLQSMGSQRVGHDWVTELNYLTYNRTMNSRVSK